MYSDIGITVLCTKENDIMMRRGREVVEVVVCVCIQENEVGRRKEKGGRWWNIYSWGS